MIYDKNLGPCREVGKKRILESEMGMSSFFRKER
jgi:hypothetical protein